MRKKVTKRRRIRFKRDLRRWAARLTFLPLLAYGSWHFYLNVQEVITTLAFLNAAPQATPVRDIGSLEPHPRATSNEDATRGMAEFLAKNKDMANKLISAGEPSPLPQMAMPTPVDDRDREATLSRMAVDWESDGGATYLDGVEDRLAPETDGQKHVARLIAVRNELFAAGPELTQDRWAKRAELQSQLVSEVVQAPDGAASLAWAFEKLKPGDNDLDRAALFQASMAPGAPEPIKAVVANAVESEMTEWAQRVQQQIPGAENQLRYKLESLGMYARPEAKLQMETLLRQALPPQPAPGSESAPEGENPSVASPPEPSTETPVTF